MPGKQLRRWLLSHGSKERAELLSQLSPPERDALHHHWPVWARPQQLAPPGDWRVWLICAGRGFGKTRAGAEWVKQIARDNPDARIALVGASMAEVRAIMIEGESGLLENCAASERPRFEPSRHQITFASGAQAAIYSAAEPESLRGPQHSYARRPSAKGVLLQRSTTHHRRAVAFDRRGHCICAAFSSRGWRLLDCWARRPIRLGREGRGDCSQPCKWMEVHFFQKRYDSL